MQPIKDEDEGIYLFGAFELDPVRRLLLKDGQALQLTPKTFDTLLALVRNRGRVMEKDELMQAIWPDTIVEESNLAHNISTLRKIFGQKGGDNRFIITAPGRGYSFVAEAQQVPRQEPRPIAQTESVPPLSALPIEPPSAPIATSAETIHQSRLPAALAGSRNFRLSWRTAIGLTVLVGLLAASGLIWTLRPARGRPIRSLAVLPFKPLVAEQRDEVLEMGIADTLISRLSSLKQVVVRPFSAVRRYTSLDQDAAAAGRELNVQAVLEGSIQKAGGKIRVTARLINAADGKPLWSRQFEETSTDIFAVQDAISQRVVGDLAVTLTGEERGELAHNYTTDPEAYNLYLIGRYHWNKRTGNGMLKSIEAFQQAIAKDPNYALAYVGLADAYATLGSYHLAPPKEVLPKAGAATDKALAIDANLAEAHATRGKIFTDYFWDWSRAENEFLRAIELKPNCANAHHWYSTLLGARGQFDEALREAGIALDLDHHSPVVTTQLGALLYRARRYDQAIAVLQKTLDLEPNYVTARLYLGMCYLMLGRHDAAATEFEEGGKIAPNTPDVIALIGYANGLRGKPEAARQGLMELNELAKHGYVPASDYSLIHNGLEEMDEVFKWLKRACDQRDPNVRGLNVDPIYDSVRDDPRFKSLLRCVGFEQ